MKYVVKFGDKNLGTFTDYDCAFHCFCENESKLIEEYGYEYDDEDTITNVCDDSHIDEFLEEMRNCKKWCTFSYTEDMLTLTEER